MMVQEASQYRLLLENLQAGVIIFCADARVQLCNEYAAQLLNISPYLLEGKSAKDSIWGLVTENGDALPLHKHPVLEVIRTGKAIKNNDLGITNNTDHIRWVDINTYPEFGADGTLNQVVLLLTDITLQKKAEDNYRLKRYVFESAKEGIIMTEVHRDANLIFCANPEFAKNSGYSESDIKGRDIRLLNSPDADPVLVEEIFDKIKAGETHKTVVRCCRKNGDQFWCSIRIAPIFDKFNRVTHYVWYLNDLTRQLEMNEEMIYSRKVLEQAQKVANIGHFVLDFNTNDIVSSQGFDEILGLDPSLPKNVQNCLTHILPDFQPRIWGRLQEIMKTGGRFAEDFITVRPIDGEQRWISAFGEVNIDKEKETVALNGIIQDISERKIAEEVANFAQRDLESIIATFPDVVLRLNEAYEISYYHTNNQEGMLSPTSQIIGRPVQEVMPAEFAAIIREKAPQTRISGKVESFEYSAVSETADTEWFEARMINATQNEIVCVIRNITEQKRAANALQESEQLLRDIFNLAPVPLVISSIDDGKIMMVNEALEKLMELPFAAFKDHSTQDFYKDTKDRAAILQQMSQKGHIRNMEVTLQRITGESKPCLLSSKLVTMNGAPTLFSGIIDITDRKKAEEGQRLNEQLLRDIFNFSPIALIITHIESGEIVMANEAAAKLAGCSITEVMGKSVKDFYARQEDRDRLLAEINTNGKVNAMEIILKTTDQALNSGLVSTSVITMNGERMLFTGFIDITERKKMEEDLNSSLDLVREQNKRLLNFSYIVSHNLRSHTSNIKTILDFIENANSIQERTDMIGHLRTVTRRLDDTLYDLNEVVSIQKNINLIIEPLNLLEYILRAAQVLREQINQKNVKLNNFVNPNIMVNYNPAYLESILLNLISNAIKYSHPSRQPEINISCRHSDDHMVLEIMDNGLGIDLLRNKDKIFGMYKTFHGNKDAKGLGLFITKNQVEAMGGSVTIESIPDKGTTFKITII